MPTHFELVFFSLSIPSSAFWVYICEVGSGHMIILLVGLTVIELYGEVTDVKKEALGARKQKGLLFPSL